MATAETVTVTAETVCESGLLSANGQTQAQLDAGLISAVKATTWRTRANTFVAGQARIRGNPAVFLIAPP